MSAIVARRRLVRRVFPVRGQLQRENGFGALRDPAEWTDTDGDGTGNNADTDDDDDGLTDVYELTVGGTDPETTTSFFIGPSPIPGDADRL
jgi:hypothetical protein